MAESGSGEASDRVVPPPGGHTRRRYTRRLLRYARKGAAAKLRKLLRAHGDELQLNGRDSRGRTALHLAAASGSEACVQLLLRVGCDAGCVDEHGDTAAHIAARTAGTLPELLLAFRAAGAPLDLRNSRSRTARDVAAEALAAAASEADARRRAAAAAQPAAGFRDDWSYRLHEEGDPEDAGEYYSQWETVAEDDAYAARESEAGTAHDEFAAPQRRSGRPQAAPVRGGGGGNAFTDWKQEQARARVEEAQRVLREEQAKDAAWRRRVTSGASLSQQRSAYEAAWAAVDADKSRAHLSSAQVPWPTPAGQEKDAPQMLLAGVAAVDHKGVLRSELLRWHPDRFGAKLGARLLASESEAVWARVNAVSRAVADAYQQAG